MACGRECIHSKQCLSPKAMHWSGKPLKEIFQDASCAYYCCFDGLNAANEALNYSSPGRTLMLTDGTSVLDAQPFGTDHKPTDTPSAPIKRWVDRKGKIYITTPDLSGIMFLGQTTETIHENLMNASL